MSKNIRFYKVNLLNGIICFFCRDVRKRQSDPERVYYNTGVADPPTGLPTTRQASHQPPSHSNDPQTPVTYDEIGDVTIQSGLKSNVEIQQATNHSYVNKTSMDEGQKDEYQNVSGPRNKQNASENVKSESIQYLSVIDDSYESLEAGNVSYQNVVTDNNTDPKWYTCLKY